MIQENKNYVIDSNATIPNKMTEPMPTDEEVSIGQAKYAKRAGVESIYKDETRNTADDNRASAKAEGSACCDNNIDQTEGTDSEQNK